MIDNPYSHSKYLLKKQFLKLFGGTFRIYDPYGNLAFFAQMKAFKLREDIRLYTSEAQTEEVLTINARNILDISATYDIFDPRTQEKVGALRRKGLKSILKDEWIILDSLDQEIGYIKEDSLLMALLRRFLTNLIPQTYDGDLQGVPVLRFKQHFNPFVLKMDLDFSSDIGNVLDRRIGIAAAVLLCAIEGRQEG
ncbi:MAG: hypothetical protein ACYC64_09120 [Armatimonadota bacterium]